MQEELLHKYAQNTNLTFYCADCALGHNKQFLVGFFSF